ncbi:hypothetical protein SASPL_107837 [Salvia splendens]|uniref:Ureide permease n=1 Tax=Salvia splendens TaxID=180675 RepID=A0A8X8YDN0_SALSN|nr:hypothetical protein SASPL_107837 [Salvia splendens]
MVRQLQMYRVESKGGAIACMLLALSFLGTWPALLTLLERQGRLPQHTYLDYTITNLLAAIIIAFTFVTEVMTSSITVVIGTTLNYFLDGKINKAEILFPGVGCFLTAVCFGTAVHSSNADDNKAKLAIYSIDRKGTAVDKNAHASKETNGNKDLENGGDKAKYGTADFLIELENKRAIKVFGKGTYIGLGITFFARLCLSFFTPAFFYI